jgi:hypothetical protein
VCPNASARWSDRAWGQLAISRLPTPWRDRSRRGGTV